MCLRCGATRTAEANCPAPGCLQCLTQTPPCQLPDPPDDTPFLARLMPGVTIPLPGGLSVICLSGCIGKTQIFLYPSMYTLRVSVPEAIAACAVSQTGTTLPASVRPTLTDHDRCLVVGLVQIADPVSFTVERIALNTFGRETSQETVHNINALHARSSAHSTRWTACRWL